MSDRDSNAHGCSPLHLAVLNGDLTVATSIAKDSPDLLDGRNSHGHTPLHYAALHGAGAEIARMMVEKGANVNAKDRAGHSPLFYAMHRRDEDMTACLLDLGADPTERDGFSSVFQNAVAKYRMRVEESSRWDARDKFGCTALHSAVDAQDADRVRGLVKEAEIDATNMNGRTPLHFAVDMGNIEIVRILLEAGANVNAEDKYDNTPLREAIRYRELDIYDLIWATGKVRLNARMLKTLELDRLHKDEWQAHLRRRIEV